MPEVSITVRGSFDSSHLPERAIVQLVVGFEGSGKKAVYERTVEAGRLVTDHVAPLHDKASGPVTAWTSDQLRTWSSRPWNAEGKRLPLVYYAAMAFEVTFSELDGIGHLLSDLLPLSGIDVGGIQWTLTAERRGDLLRMAREGAVRDAQTKAATYAAALGLVKVWPVVLADAGMLDRGNPGSPLMPHDFTRAAAVHNEAPMQISSVPQKLTLSAVVDATFKGE